MKIIDEEAKKHLTKLAYEMTDKYFAQSMAIGKILKHPDGRTVKVKSGCFHDLKYGRVSNWWVWNEVLEDGVLGPDESGYGW